MGEIHERPILFSGKMIQAILAGHKTQTRRLVSGRFADPVSGFDQAFARIAGERRYGQAGDRLWVRETWAPHADEEETFRNYTRSMSGRGGPDEPGIVRPQIFYRADGGDPFFTRWRPAIHMPRWASRIALEVLAIRAQRLQEISEADAKAEGVEPMEGVPPKQRIAGDLFGRTFGSHPYTAALAVLWDTINANRWPDGAAAWAANPWVLAVSFQRVTP